MYPSDDETKCCKWRCACGIQIDTGHTGIRTIDKKTSEARYPLSQKRYDFFLFCCTVTQRSTVVLSRNQLRQVLVFLMARFKKSFRAVAKPTCSPAALSCAGNLHGDRVEPRRYRRNRPPSVCVGDGRRKVERNNIANFIVARRLGTYRSEHSRRAAAAV